MTRKASTILQEALQLPDADRADIACQLLATLVTDGEEHSDEELGEELEHRLSEYRHDPSTAVSWTDLRNEC